MDVCGSGMSALGFATMRQTMTMSLINQIEPVTSLRDPEKEKSKIGKAAVDLAHEGLGAGDFPLSPLCTYQRVGKDGGWCIQKVSQNSVGALLTLLAVM